MRIRAESRPEKLEKALYKPMPNTMLAFRLEVPDQNWLMDLRPYIKDSGVETSYAKFIERKDGDLSYPDYFTQRLVEAWRMFTRAGCFLTTLIKIEYISRCLLHMIRHTMLTLHHSSPAMQVIGTSNPVIGEYVSAMISVLLAVSYLLVLVNLLIAVGKIVKLIGKTLWLLRFPIGVVVFLLKWCIFS